MNPESKFAVARTAFAELKPEPPSADFDARLRRRLTPAPARRWTLGDLFALTPAFAAAAAAGFALVRLGHMPPARTVGAPEVEAFALSSDDGLRGYDPIESPCSTARDCN